MVRLLILLSLVLSLAGPAKAQDRATLLADSLSIVGGNRLIAEGNVEIFFQGQHLIASRLIYDASSGSLIIEGPIRIQDDKGNVILADQAQLSDDLNEGILTSARLVLSNRLQLAAAEVRRSDGGRFTGLVQVAASSCNICGGVPLWEIRAKSVLHDVDEQQLYFSGAQLRFSGVPVFYLPRLRLPDPTLDRASGFLIPSLSSSSRRGIGLSFPYFLTLGANRDLTFTPLLTTESGRALELRYREALLNGTYTVIGSVSQDQLGNGALRGYLEAEGEFSLPLGFSATANGIVVSDTSYLSDYGISDADRLDSRVTVTRTRRNEFIEAEAIGFQTLRSDEDNTTLPVAIADLIFHRRFSADVIGGQGGFLLEAHSHYRPSDEVSDLNADGIADGRDLSRLSFGGDWRRNWTIGNGLMIATMAEVSADYYSIAQDQTYGGKKWRTYAV
jgi:LPS-assembly protein